MGIVTQSDRQRNSVFIATESINILDSSIEDLKNSIADRDEESRIKF